MARPATAVSLVLAFVAGFFCHLLYQRWNPVPEVTPVAEPVQSPGQPQSYRVSFAPLALPVQSESEQPLLQAREVDKIRALSGSYARVRGRVFRVGHSVKSNTYFLNFGPSREALTGVIFGSAAERFEKHKVEPKSLEGKEVEIAGEIKDHPQYGLELIIEDPTRVVVLKQ
jgi:hypothetical protein